MIEIVTAPLLLAAVPIIGAMLGLMVWSQPDKLRTWSVIVTGLVCWLSSECPDSCTEYD